MLQVGRFNVLIDGQFGSTGKGLFAGYVSTAHPVDVAVTNAAPNAGHTFISGGKKVVCKHLPISGVLNPSSLIYLCAGAIIDPRKLAKEVEQYGIDQNRIHIHPRAAIISEQDIEHERDVTSSTTSLASTQSGVGRALANKVMRMPGSIAGTVDWASHGLGGIKLMPLDLNYLMANGGTVMMEVPQGFDLGINDGFAFPFCTSRPVTVSSAMADANVHPRFLGNVLMTLRTYPIRVGHIYDKNDPDLIIGHSGPFYPDSTEIAWQDLGVEPEITTVTGRVRRIATFSMEQYKRACSSMHPDVVFLNFANYMEEDKLRDLIHKMWDIYRPDVTYTGHGPDMSDVWPYPSPYAPRGDGSAMRRT